MSIILLTSILIRIVAMLWSISLLRQTRDWRMGFLTIMISFMAMRQILTFWDTLESWTLSYSWHITELPGLIVSIMGLLAIYFLKRMLTEHHDVLKELRSSEYQYRETVDFLPQVILEADMDGRITFTNKTGYAMFGDIDNDRGERLFISDLLIPEDAQRARVNIQNILKGEKKGPNKYTLLRHDGSTYTGLVYSDPIVRDGEVRGIRGLIVDISELTKAQEKLRDSEANLREAQRVAEIGSWEDDLATGDVFWSDQMFHIYNLDPSLPVPSLDDMMLYIHPDDRAYVDDIYAEYGKTVQDYDIVYRLLLRDKRIKYVNERCQTSCDDSGQAISSFGTFQDITSYQQAQIELRKSEEKYRTLVESSPYCIHQIDADGRIMSMNRKGLQMLGLTDEEEILGVDYLDAVREDKRAYISALMDAAFKGKYAEFEFPGSNGMEFRSNFVPVTGIEGKVDRLFGITQDITEQKQAEAALKASEARFRGVFEQAAVGVGLVSPNTGEIVRINRYYCDLLGYSMDELSDVHALHNITHPDDLQKSVRALEKLANREIGQYTMDKRYIHKNGSIVWVSVMVSAIVSPDNSIDYYIGVAQNITERKYAEEELRKLSRGIEASSSSVIITDVEGHIEYVNPQFTAITGYTRKEAIGQHISMLRSGDSPESVFEKLWRTVKTGAVWKGELRDRKKDGNLYWARTAITGVKDSEGAITHFIIMQEDVTHEYELSEQLNYQATHDALTGLVNRREFERRAERLLASVRQEHSEHALCYMDLDQFKVVNDTCGHIAGDEMMRQISALLQETVRKRDTLARLGGDEFGVLMEHCSPDHAHRVASNLQKVIQEYQFNWEGHVFKVGVSIGLVSITEAFPNLTELLKQADSACYMAKDLGRNRIHVYHGEDLSLSQRQGEMQWVTRIYKALEQNRFCLYAQTIISLDNNRDRHYELLLRMIDEQGQVIPPGAFLPAAERYNLIEQLDAWVIEKVFTLLSSNPVFLEQVNFISINLSGQSLTKADFLEFIVSSLEKFKIEPGKICFEITETTAITNLTAAATFISTLKMLGCRFALDDFGSGLSSFGYLKNLSVDYLKIDGMFVKDIVEDPIDRAMVKSINEIGHVMGMQTIAEFVENDEIKGMLREIGVNYAQGYGIDKPRSFDELLTRSNNIADFRAAGDTAD